MEKFVKMGRVFFAIGLAGFGIQQFMYSDFRPMIIPAWPALIPGLTFFAWICGLILIACAAAIIFQKWPRTASLVIGGIFLALFLCSQVPHLLYVEKYAHHLPLWTDALKESAISGGAFVIAGTFGEEKINGKKYFIFTVLEKFIPVGRILFAVTMIAFGLDHLLYTRFVKDIVPGWIPAHAFWTVFTGIALIGGGVGVIFRIQIKWISILLGIMIFLWVIMLHLPGAINDPYVDKGNLVTSFFQALAFSGIAFVIGGCSSGKNFAQS